MNSYDKDLAHSIMIKFGTAPSEPNESQLASIKREIETIKTVGRVPSDADWFRVVNKYCPGAGKHFYAGVDNSDLNTLLLLAIQAVRR